MKKKLTLVLFGALALLSMPLMSFALDSSQFQETLETLSTYVNYLIAFGIGVAVLIFIFGLFKYVTAGGDPEQLKAARNTIIMGIIIIAVMVGVWGLVNFVVSSVGLDDNNAPTQIPQVPSISGGNNDYSGQ